MEQTVLEEVQALRNAVAAGKAENQQLRADIVARTESLDAALESRAKMEADLTLEFIAMVQWLMMNGCQKTQLVKLEAYLIVRCNRLDDRGGSSVDVHHELPKDFAEHLVIVERP